MKISDYSGVWVFIEQRDCNIHKVGIELLGKGREIADKLGEKLTAVLVGYNVENKAEELIHYGADHVIVVENEKLDIYMTKPYTKVLSNLVNDRKPNVFLIGATAIGRDLAPRIAARVRTGLTADCTSIDVEENTTNILMTRPAFGGNIMATIICPDHRPQMSTVRPGVMKKPEKDETRSGIIEKIDISIEKEDIDVEILSVVKEEKNKINIEDANVLVSAGRGIGKKENLHKLSELAKLLSGTVSGSRAVVDAGWIEKNNQVGQTGKTVRPNLYIACGISGAIQHIVGMEESEFIVAINNNPDAPIFEVADVGIVADANQVVLSLIDELKKEKNIS
ncbi:electron transfer flavoprotein alpha subunit apoprotein [Alkalithermobacter thermoalcaliphilus JW-YL-7 = DSM 7308]|uniref:Electron transfer flavoprotein alpha subunit apoprotein n=2 Tax=Alkalithermobacter thermoalcaliphilus JW-YL-7 = DSM 7308 TaxID=1121328 RepID=A0A150FQ36_CLOPD|nr:Electron transfer flavoprotein alpha/beta-subunit [[Clostridium] paradoxum JW-YL-7 = DSM 7308]SHK83247.1 electron transfer flavoprotein alpha subunit apoprotein [[Clostridium] paradoxum JW-YL-7 = DSM 7308]